jgi:hypothetical protein
MSKDYIAATLMYNLQILPESLMTGIVLLAIILANQSLMVLAAGAAATQLLTAAAGSVIMRMSPDNAVRTSSLDPCTAGFIGQSWDRLLRGIQVPERLWHPAAPSVYMATVGFFVAYGLAVQTLYKEEIDKRVVSRATLISTSVIAFGLLIAAFLFRVWSGCESVMGAVGGTAFGFAIGYLGCIAIGYTTDRRATNIWGIPLLRDRINNGSAVYVCPT